MDRDASTQPKHYSDSSRNSDRSRSPILRGMHGPLMRQGLAQTCITRQCQFSCLMNSIWIVFSGSSSCIGGIWMNLVVGRVLTSGWLRWFGQRPGCVLRNTVVRAPHCTCTDTCQVAEIPLTVGYRRDRQAYHLVWTEMHPHSQNITQIHPETQTGAEVLSCVACTGR